MILNKIKTKLILILINILLAGLSGCVANFNKINNINNFNIKNIPKHWKLHGKMSWHHKPTKHAAMCYVIWQKNNKISKITFRSAMNLKHVSMESDGNNIKIINSSNHFDEVQQDLEHISKNMSLDLNHLNYWLLGVPDPNSKYLLINNKINNKNKDQNKYSFIQNNWEIICSEYKNYNDFMLPTKIVMQNIKSQTIVKFVIFAVTMDF